MKFIDTLVINVSGGKGGKGCVSFRREKYVPKGGPNGGDGGKGGDVIIEGDSGIQTLLDLRYSRDYKAPNGENGKGSDMTGRSGSPLVIKVPFGTVVFDNETGDLLADISYEAPSFLAAEGGAGGRGNAAFVSATHRAPRMSEPGSDGDSHSLRLELKLIADVGIVGYPNAGKSTFISVVSAAKPKVADYPFTTLTPILGVIKNEYGSSYVMADMPGLIEGASEGVGLGLRFLRHIERTSLLLHFVDSSSEISMVDSYKNIRVELERYSKSVSEKREIVVATKVDSANRDNLVEFDNYMKMLNKQYFKISSLSKEGVLELMQCVNHIFQPK